MTAAGDSPRTVALRAVRESGQILREHFGRVKDIRFKGLTDLVTEADLASEHKIVEIIRSGFPDHVILGEEGGSRGEGEHRWLVDPLDGTTNYAHGYPLFAVSIAYEVSGELRLGVVYAPAMDELFVAERGGGAFLNGERLAVSDTGELIRSMLVTGFHYRPDVAARNLAHFESLLPKTQAIRRDGSAALDLCYVAAGRFDGYWELGLQPWDTAAGTLIAREAGGVVSDEKGEKYCPGGSVCVASNGRIHRQILEVLSDGGGAL